jgi:hypothetical protein
VCGECQIRNTILGRRSIHKELFAARANFLAKIPQFSELRFEKTLHRRI